MGDAWRACIHARARASWLWGRVHTDTCQRVLTIGTHCVPLGTWHDGVCGTIWWAIYTHQSLVCCDRFVARRRIMVERIAHWLSASGASETSSEAVPTGSEHQPESGIGRSSSQTLIRCLSHFILSLLLTRCLSPSLDINLSLTLTPTLSPSLTLCLLSLTHSISHCLPHLLA